MGQLMEGDQLFGLPLERFIPERAALVRALKADGRREQAAEVAALRKPSAAAWAVNQLVRTQGPAVAELFAAGDALRQAHERLLAGEGEGPGLREAVEREREAVSALVSAARGLLSGDGHELSPAVLDRVAETLHAAALEEEAREQVRRGTLGRELRHVGLGLAGAPATATRGRRARPAAAKQQAPSRKGPTRAERAALEQARRLAERGERAARDARQRRDRAQSALAEAEDALAQALAEAEAASDEYQNLQRSMQSDAGGRAR